MRSDKRTKVAQKAQHLIQQDGTTMITYGLLQAIMALDFYNQRFLLPLIIAAVALPALQKFFRRKVTYPRTGFAAFPKSTGEKSLPFIIGLAGILMVVVIFAGFKGATMFIPYFVGGGLALWAVVNGLTFGERIWFIFAFLYLLAALISHTVIADSPVQACYIQLWIVAPLLTIAGIYKLVRFLQTYPKPIPEVNNGIAG